MTQNDLLSKELKVEPLKPGETATYKLIGAGFISRRISDYKSGKHKPLYPAFFQLPKSIVISDPKAQNDTILLQSIIGMQPLVSKPGEEQKFSPIVKPITFTDNGSITITHDQKEWYLYMERYPRNRDNHFRTTTKPPIFYRDNPERDLQIEIDRNETIADMMAHLRSLTASGVEKIAAELKASGDSRFAGLQPSQEAQVLRNQLYKMAKLNNNAEVMYEYSGDPTFIITKKMMDLIRIEKIHFDPNERIWNIKRAVGEAGPKKFSAYVEPGNDKIAAMVEFMRTGPGKKDFDTMMSLHVDFYENL